MKTLVRVTKETSGNYEHLFIQVFVKPYKEGTMVDVLGHIRFQRNIDGSNDGEWYGRRYSLELDRARDIVAFGKVAKHIEDNCYNDASPEEVLRVLGAVEHFIFRNEFTKKSDIGSYRYKITTEAYPNNWSYLIAPNDILAEKELVRQKRDGYVLGEKELITENLY